MIPVPWVTVRRRWKMLQAARVLTPSMSQPAIEILCMHSHNPRSMVNCMQALGDVASSESAHTEDESAEDGSASHLGSGFEGEPEAQLIADREKSGEGRDGISARGVREGVAHSLLCGNSRDMEAQQGPRGMAASEGGGAATALGEEGVAKEEPDSQPAAPAPEHAPETAAPVDHMDCPPLKASLWGGTPIQAGRRVLQ
eukprot:scaffold113118_cov20-Tisochrysis_lutea.AAC.1